MEAEERSREGLDRRDRAAAPAAAEERDGSAIPEVSEAEPATAIEHERCAHHPGRAAVARCDACERPVCLSCAVPVRGRVLGPECLAAELGDPALVAPPEPERRGPTIWVTVAGAGIALLGTAGPWTLTGAGNRLLGAWVPTLRWSVVAAVASLVLAIALGWVRAPQRGTAPAILVFAVTVLTASVLAIAFPPTFQSASWGAWTTAGGGTLAAAGAAAHLLIERRSTQGV